MLSDTCVKLAGWSKTKSWSAVATKSRPLSAIDRFCIPVGSAADGQTTIDVLITVGVVSTPVPSIPPHRQRANVGVSSPAWRLSWSKPSMKAS